MISNVLPKIFNQNKKFISKVFPNWKYKNFDFQFQKCKIKISKKFGNQKQNNFKNVISKRFPNDFQDFQFGNGTISNDFQIGNQKKPKK